MDDAGGVAGDVVDRAPGVGGAVWHELLGKDFDPAGERRAWDRRDENAGDKVRTPG